MKYFSTLTQINDIKDTNHRFVPILKLYLLSLITNLNHYFLRQNIILKFSNFFHLFTLLLLYHFIPFFNNNI